VPNFLTIGLGVSIPWGIEFLAFSYERDAAVNTGLELYRSACDESFRSVKFLTMPSSSDEKLIVQTVTACADESHLAAQMTFLLYSRLHLYARRL